MAWTRKDTIVIDHTKVPNTDQTDFPVPIIITDSNYKSVGNGGYMQNGSAYDIKFYSDSALTTALPYVRIFHNLTTGAIFYIVKRTLSHTADTNIYAGFGDSAVTTDQSDAANAFPSSCKAFFLFGDGSTLSVNDSTSNAITGTNSGVTATTGPFAGGTLGGAGNFSNANISLGNNLGLTGDMTISFWGYSTNWSQAFSKASAATGVASPIDNSFSGAYNQARMSVGDGSTDTGHTIRTANTPPSNTWTFYSWQISGTAWSVRKNNTADNSGTGLSQTRTNNASLNMLIGANNANSEHFAGKIGALRFYNTALSADWRDTEYNSENSPSTFSSHTFSSPSTAYTQNPSDTATLSDAIGKSETKVLSDSVTLSDAITKSPGLIKSDSVSLTDAAVKALTGNKSDSVSTSDSIAKSEGLSKSDTISLADAISKILTLNKSDTATLADLLSKTVVFVRTFSDAVTLSDAIIKAVGLNKSDSATLSDLIASTFGVSKSDAVSISDANSKSIAANKSDSISISDSSAKASSLAKSDSVILSDTKSVSSSVSKTDSVSLADSAIKSVTLNKSDSVSLEDIIVKSFGLGKSDAITLSDLFSSSDSISLSLSDSVTIADVLTKAASFTKSLSDTVSISDSIIKLFGLSKTDITTLNDLLAKSSGVTKSDVVSLVDIIAKSFGLSKGDTLILSDLINAGGGMQALLSDDISLTDLPTFTLQASSTSSGHGKPGSSYEVKEDGELLWREKKEKEQKNKIIRQNELILSLACWVLNEE